jgi:DNA invertase Pin-like site-specific DNA recombinase
MAQATAILSDPTTEDMRKASKSRNRAGFRLALTPTDHQRTSRTAAEANASLLRQHAAVILARRAALREVKRRRQKQGLRQTLPYSVLSRLANEWLADHPELYTEAMASPIVQELGITNRSRRPDPKQELLCKSQVQKWGPAMIVGYARVSTDGQSVESQHSALRQAGAEQVFSEKISGAVTDRRQLAKAISALGPGDALLVTRLDRLARSTRDLLNVLDAVSKAGAGFRSLADAWADTTTAHGKLMITILAGLAEFERSLILARTSEGRVRAKARGVRFGRKPTLTPHQRQEALARRAAGEALVEIARTYNVSHSTISRLGAIRDDRDTARI